MIVSVLLVACMHKPIDEGKVVYGCDFNPENYIRKPKESSSNNIGKVYIWIKRNIFGGSTGFHGKRFIAQLDAYFRLQQKDTNKSSRVEKIWGIGSKVTRKDLGAYILMMDRDNGMRLIEIPEKDESRFNIETDRIKLLMQRKCRQTQL